MSAPHTPRPAARRPALGVEQLADRLTPATLSLANGVLTIAGTDAADTVAVTQTGDCQGAITVTAATAGQAPQVRTFTTAQVRKLFFDGRAGNDRFDNGSYVASEANGGAGSDTLRGGFSADVLHGGNDSDLVDGSFGDDLIHASPGEDELAGGGGHDTLQSTGSRMDLSDARLDWYGATFRETDRLSGFEHAVLHGTAGDDAINAFAFSGWTAQYGYGGNDGLSGSNVGGDFIDAGAGDDTVSGFGGADELRGGDGSDKVYGGLGNDVIYGNSGRDELFGNEGDDHIDVGGGHQSDVVYGGWGDDTIYGDWTTFVGDAGNKWHSKDGW